jgi:hypothetical protein
MLDFFAGVPGKLKTLTDRLSSGRATALDNLDAAITTRAAASTALSNATWTNTKAGYLDAAISSIAAGAIQSIQTGFANQVMVAVSSGEDLRYIDITISAVAATNKCFVFLQAPWTNEDSTGWYVYGRLTSTTNLRCGSPVSGYVRMSGRWWVIEFK